MTATAARTGEDPPAPGAAHISAGEGPTVWLNGDIYELKAGSTATSEQMAVLEATVPPGGGPPPHLHKHEDEAFYVVDGELDVRIGERTVRASSGDFVFIPRDTVHSFHNPGLRIARQLLIFTPGGFEEFFLEAGEPAMAGRPIPPPSAGEQPRIKATAEKYGSPQAS